MGGTCSWALKKPLSPTASDSTGPYAAACYGLHPANAETVRRVMSRLGMHTPVNVIEDPTLRRGSLLIDFPNGQLDASVETQLAEIERGFVDIVRHS